MKAQFKCSGMEFSLTEHMLWDFGFIVDIYHAETPLGHYGYYRIPADYPENEAGEAKPGEYFVSGPGYDEDGEPERLGNAKTSIAAQLMCKRDFERRVNECLALVSP